MTDFLIECVWISVRAAIGGFIVGCALWIPFLLIGGGIELLRGAWGILAHAFNPSAAHIDKED